MGKIGTEICQRQVLFWMTSVSSLRVAHVALWGLASDRVATHNELSLIIGDSTLRSFASHLKTRGRGVSNYCITGGGGGNHAASSPFEPMLSPKQH